MKRIVTLNTRNLEESKLHGGCGECQTSCQSADVENAKHHANQHVKHLAV